MAGYPGPVRILVVNGPNLNLLGTRRPDVYGNTTLPELESLCRAWGEDLGSAVETFQTNHEGAIIDRLHQAAGQFDGIVLNAGALTHYSYAIRDAVEAIPLPVVEVHISEIASREPWRAHSVLTEVCAAGIAGHGIEGYREALEFLVSTRPSGRS
jgi:3-dehydroquinate dehydratase-2